MSPGKDEALVADYVLRIAKEHTHVLKFLLADPTRTQVSVKPFTVSNVLL